MFTGQYRGTGTQRASNPITISFPFPISVFWFPVNSTGISQNISRPVYFAGLSSNDYQEIISYNARSLYGKKTSDNKTIQWYAQPYNSSSSYQQEAISNQFNVSGVIYYYMGLGNYDAGGQTEWLLTKSQTFTVPRTGSYYIELYGGGGGANMYSNSSDGSCTGGSSCQTYDSIQLTMNQQINVIIGEAGKSYSSQASTSGGSTTFGTYTVSGGTRSFYDLNQNQYYYSLGSGARNKGTSGQSGWSLNKINPNTGVYRSIYRYGGFSYNSGNNIEYLGGGPRAVYLKYLES